MSSRSPLQRIDDAVLYGAGYVAAVASTLGLTMTVGSRWFSWQAIALVSAGFATSWVMHARGSRSRAVPYLLLVVALAAASPWWADPERFGRLIPSELFEEWDYLVAGVIFLFMALRTFSLLTRGDLLFGVVPGLSLFGVMAHRGIDADYMVAFFVFVLASAYLVAYDHLLELRSHADAEAPLPTERALRWDHLIATTVVGLLCLAAAGGASLALRLAGERYRTSVLGGITAVAPRPVGIRPGWMAGGDRVRVGIGPIKLSPQVALQVTTRTPGNWRQKVYDHYEWHGWSRSPRPEPIVGDQGEFDFRDLLGFRPGRGEQHEEYYEVRVVNDRGPDLVSAAPATRVRLRRADGTVPAQAYLDWHGTVTLGEQAALTPGDRYRVTAQSGAEVRVPPGVQTQVETRSLRLPRGYLYYCPRLRDLVATLTGHLDDDLAKVHAIEDYLLENCRYNARAAAVPPTEKDVVEYFLFKSQEGYCDLFATAMCVMCRVAGIPARFAVGYTAGEYDDASQSFVVRERDRHAWAEVLLKDVGWVAFDPAATAVREPESRRAFAWLSPIGRFLRRHARAIGVLAVIVLAIYLIAHLHPRTKRQAALRMPRGPSSDVVTCYQRGCRLLEGIGCRRQAWQTASEYAAACRGAPALSPAWGPFGQLTALFLKARYHPSGADRADVRGASAAFSALRSSLRRGSHNSLQRARTARP